MSDVLKEISKILDEGLVRNEIDFDARNRSGNYLSIKHPNKRRIIFTHYFEKGYIQAMIRKNKPPEGIEKEYGIKGTVHRKEYIKTHYILNIPITPDMLINGKYTIQDKKDFFIDIAEDR